MPVSEVSCQAIPFLGGARQCRHHFIKHVDPSLKQQTFPEHEDFHRIVHEGPFEHGSAAEQELKMVDTLRTVQAPEADIFSLDNTNTIEGYFSTINKRLQQPTRTLADVYEAIIFIEERSLAQLNPSQPMLPERLVEGLSFILSVTSSGSCQ